MPPTVLVADDDPSIVELVTEVLEDEGYRIRSACDGRDAIRSIATEPPDLLLTDVMMPYLDGMAVTRQLRAQGNQTPVVLMSAVRPMMQLPGVSFVAKPFDFGLLVQVVADGLAAHGDLA